MCALPAVSPEEVHALAVAVFQAKRDRKSSLFLHLTSPHLSSSSPALSSHPVGEDVLGIAAALFKHAGQEGETNALYTYAQLLRTGESHLTQCTAGHH